MHFEIPADGDGNLTAVTLAVVSRIFGLENNPLIIIFLPEWPCWLEIIGTLCVLIPIYRTSTVGLQPLPFRVVGVIHHLLAKEVQLSDADPAVVATSPREPTMRP